MISMKLDQQAASAIKSILQELSIDDSRVWIDLDEKTVEVQEGDCSIEDLLNADGYEY
jgi:hypothetical protein